MATRSRALVVDDPECERLLLRYITSHPRADLSDVCRTFTWSKQAITELLNRLIAEWKLCWRMEQQRTDNGRNPSRRVYWIAPADLRERADPGRAADRIVRELTCDAEATRFYFHTGTLISEAGSIQVFRVAGRRP